MAMKRLPALPAPSVFFDAIEEILLEDVRFERRAGFARNDENRIRQIHLVLERLHLRRIGGIQHEQLRKAVDLSERHPQNFGTQAGSAHAEQQRMLEPRRFHILGDVLQMLLVRQLIFGDAQPAQPVAFIRSGPERRVARPQPPHLARHFPIVDGL